MGKGQLMQTAVRFLALHAALRQAPVPRAHARLLLRAPHQHSLLLRCTDASMLRCSLLGQCAVHGRCAY